MNRNFCLGILGLLSIIGTLSAQSKPIKTTQGLVQGMQQGEVRIFLGIPFAAAPVGNLRWKAPQAAERWAGIRACTKFPASAIQNKPVPFSMWTEEFIAPPEPLSEDCLYLNIWTTAKAKAKRPVLVWIHGGGFVSGASTCAVYDGQAMAQQGLIYVSINYRLGVFGFLAHPELSQESGQQASGNYALLDQIAALQWIQKNIAAFGGDPNNVTIAGQSAGSFAVHALIASPLAKGLFHRAIAQSGGLFNSARTKTLPDAEKIGLSLSKKMNAESLTDLRKKSPEEILAAANTLPFGSFAPVNDGYVLPLQLLDHFRAGKQNQVPILSGWVSGDGNLFPAQPWSAQQYIENSKKTYGERAEAFLALFPGNTDEQAKASTVKRNLIGFAVFSAHMLAKTNPKASYLYQFSHVPVDKPGFPNYGAFHTAEVPFALHTLKHWNRPWRPEDYALERIMSSYWVNFARSGNPNGPGLPQWQPYDGTKGEIMDLGTNVAPAPGLFKAELQFMENLQQ